MSRRPLFVLAFCLAAAMISIIAPRVPRAAPPQATDGSGTVYFPQVADTGGYTTSFLLVNPEAAVVTGKVSFRKQDGAPMVVATELGTGSTVDFRLDSRSTVRFTTGGSAGIGWASLEASGPVVASALYEFRRGGTLVDDVGVLGTALRSSFALYAISKGSERIGLALANPAAESATITLRLYQDGSVLETRNLTLQPGRQVADFLDGAAFFNRADFEGYVEASSNVPVAALGLALDEDQLSSIALPADAEAKAGNVYFPQVADIAGYKTSFVLVNPQDTPATGLIEFTLQEGGPMQVSTSLGAGNIQAFEVPARGVKRFTTAGTSGIGWARLSVDRPVVASELFKYAPGGALSDQVGVLGAIPRESFSLYAISQDRERIGLALANPGTAAASVTLKLFDTKGIPKDTRTIVLQPGTQKADFLDGSTYFGAGKFEGYVAVDSTAPVVALGLASTEEQFFSLALPVPSVSGSVSGKIDLKLFWPMPEGIRPFIRDNRTLLTGYYGSVAPDGSLLVFKDIPPHSLSVQVGTQTAEVDMDGSFTLRVPAGATGGQILHAIRADPVGTFAIAQLAAAGRTPIAMVLPLEFTGPCDMDGTDDKRCSAPSAAHALHRIAATYPPGDRATDCLFDDGDLKNTIDTTGKVTSYLHIVKYIGSTCYKRVQSGCCPGEGGKLFERKKISCWQNHKGRFCQELTPGDLELNGNTVSVFDEVTLGQSFKLTVHNNACFAETKVEKSSESTLKGDLSGEGLADNLIKHYDATLLTTTFNKSSGTGSNKTFIADRVLTYQPPKCITDATAKDIYDFKLVDEDKTLRFTFRVKRTNLLRFKGTTTIFSADNAARDGFTLAAVDAGCTDVHIHGKHPCTGAADPAPQGCGHGIYEKQP